MEAEPSRLSMHLQIPGPHYVAVNRYGDWQYPQVTGKTLKMEYKKAYDLTLRLRIAKESKVRSDILGRARDAQR